MRNDIYAETRALKKAGMAALLSVTQPLFSTVPLTTRLVPRNQLGLPLTEICLAGRLV